LYIQAQSAEKLMKKLVTVYASREDEMSRSGVALALKAVAKAKLDHLKDNEHTLAPMLFLAMHGPKDDGTPHLTHFDDRFGVLGCILATQKVVGSIPTQDKHLSVFLCLFVMSLCCQ
jgi:hypothetical protein